MSYDKSVETQRSVITLESETRQCLKALSAILIVQKRLNIHHVTVTSLEILYLKENPLRADGAKALARSCAFQSMKELYLGRTQLGNDGLAQLCNGGPWPRLETLSLAQNGLDDKSAQMLAEANLFPKLITLDLYNNNISDEAVDAIRCSPNLKCLRILQVN